MKTLIKKITTFFPVVLLLFSCNDEFVNDKMDISDVAESAIFISPDWDADDYQFRCEALGDETFKIESHPEWLNIESYSGKFDDGVATIHCSASAEPRYSETGIYTDQMLITAKGGKYAVPLYYIIEGNPSVEVEASHTIRFNGNPPLEITNRGNGILIWDILSMPEWLIVDMNQFNVNSLILGQGASGQIPLILNPETLLNTELSGEIILVTNDKNDPIKRISVSVDIGIPQLQINSYELPLNFGTTATTLPLNFYVGGNGLLIWRIENLPAWLTVSPSGGVFASHNYNEGITFTCDRSKLQPGINATTVYLNSNDPENPSFAIDVIARTPGSAANIFALEGNIVDAVYDKNTDILYYVSGQPNKLLAYDVHTKKVVREVALDKAPTCLAISEDFSKAAVGHGGLISAINLNTFSVTGTFEYGYSIYDMEWAYDNWFCYTKAGTYMNNMLWINTSTSETAESDDNEMDEGTYIKKTPAQPYIIAARRFSSPSGITVIDTQTKLEKNYRHQSIGNFWFSSDGQYMYESTGDVYKTSAIVGPSGRNPEYIAPIGKMQVPEGGYSFNVISWIDYSETTKSIMVLSHDSPVIYRLEDNDFTLVQKYYYDDLYQPNTQTAAYGVKAHFVFSTGDGMKLAVLRKGVNNNNWTIEYISAE